MSRQLSSYSIGKFTFVILLLATFIIGAFISYLWVLGYYVALGLKVPEKPVITVSNLSFSPQDPSFFDVSILNPSFSPANVKVSEIHVLTEDNAIHKIGNTYPSIPTGGYVLRVGETKTFKCYWNWANYTGQKIKVIVFVAEGSGGTFQDTLPLVSIEVADFSLDLAFGDRFNLTVKNSEGSVISVNITRITVTLENGTVLEVSLITPTLPYALDKDATVTFTCLWNWTEYRDKEVKVTVYTSQGYRASATRKTPP